LAALAEVRSQINEFRLPIDVVALRTGTLTDELEIEDYGLHFAELEAQYATWRARTLGRLAEVAVRFYDTKILDANRGAQPSTPIALPRAPLMRRLAGYRYLRGTVGEFYEANYDQHTAATPFTVGFDFNYFWHILTIHALVRLENSFATELRNLDYETAEETLANLMTGGRFLARLGAIGLNDAQVGGAATSAKLDLEELSDQLDELITAGDLDALRALHAAYAKRREDILRRQLFSVFQEEHPGLQFKAGTEVGGTFVMVYHGEQSEDGTRPQQGRFRITGRVMADGEILIGASITVVGSSSGTVTDIDGRFSIFINQLPTRLQISYLGVGSAEVLVTRESQFLDIDLSDQQVSPNEVPIEGVDEGTVIADFYLPYRCCGQGAPIQVFPPEPPEPPVELLIANFVQETCSQPQEETGVLFAQARLIVSGGTPPYFREDGAGNRQPVTEQAFGVASGNTITVVDSAEQRTPVSFTLMPVLRLELVGEPICAENNATFSHEFIVEGGKPPYRFTDPAGTVRTVTAGQVAMVQGISSGEAFQLEVEDGFGADCFTFIATRASYPMWAQRPATRGIVYRNFKFQLDQFRLILDDGTQLALTDQDLTNLNDNLNARLSQLPGGLTSSNYSGTMTSLVSNIMKFVDATINAQAGLPDRQRAIELNTLASGNFNRLVVETFDCYRFLIIVSVQYTETDEASGAKVDRDRKLVYENERVQLSDSEAFSSFERFRVNRCDPDGKIEPLCEEEVTVGIDRDGNEFFARTELTSGPEFWWDFQLGTPGLAAGDSVKVDFDFDGTDTVAQVLMVDSNSGCFNTATSRVNQ